jgi:uncharacterized sulfatase
MITRREFCSLAGVAPLSAAPAKKLNVLLIAVDDLNTRLGCYGDPVVKSPNIDRLAARGVRFDSAYCNFPLCNPSRTSLLSGRRPDTTRIHGNQVQPRTYLGDIQFLPEYFKAHGYFTARVGKVAHGAFEHYVKWDISENARRGEAVAARDNTQKTKSGKARKGGEAMKLEWRPTENPDELEPDGNTARRVARIIREQKDGPFFIGAGFHKPHLPWVAPKKYFDLYPADRIQLPYAPPNDRDDIPPIALTRTAGDDRMTDADKQQAIAAYHACTTFTDAQIGVLLDALDELKLWDSTVVLLFGDHGWHLGEHHGLWRKMTLFEESDRAPLIVAAPGMETGVVSRRLVEFVDIYPTLVELAGLPQAAGMEGMSMTPLLRDHNRPWKSAIFTWVARGQNTLGHTMRTERYRYTEWGGDKVIEVYDHEKDPKEFTNLARVPGNEKLVAELRGKMRAGWKAAAPK